MYIRRKVFSMANDYDYLSETEERAFCEGYQQRMFDEAEEKEEKKKSSHNGLKALAGLGIGGGILSTTKTGRLTGKVTRYHDTEMKNVDNILNEGIKSKFAEDPTNITNKCLPDVPMEKKKGLVYTAKDKSTAFGVGEQRRNLQGKGYGGIKDYITKTSPEHKVLELEFDYDDIKKNKKIINPELRGATNAKDFYNKTEGRGLFARDWNNLGKAEKHLRKKAFDSLNDGTHIFDHNIDPSHIVGGKGYKKRTWKQVGNYIKNNPGRFGKEAAKVAAGVGITAYGGKKLYDKIKEKKNKDKD